MLSADLKSHVQQIVEDAMDSAIPEPWEVSAQAADAILSLLGLGGEGERGTRHV